MIEKLNWVGLSLQPDSNLGQLDRKHERSTIELWCHTATIILNNNHFAFIIGASDVLKPGKVAQKGDFRIKKILTVTRKTPFHLLNKNKQRRKI